MRLRSIFIALLLLNLFLQTSAQETGSPKKIFYKYTFEGMKDSSEVAALNKAVLQLKNVTASDVIFKTADHKYALLKVEVSVPESFNENSQDVTGPSTLKNLLGRLGYIPAECKTSYEN